MILRRLEFLFPKVTKAIVYDALNQRLGKEGLFYDGIWEELYRRDMTLEDLIKIPENDKWKYNTPSGLKSQLTCSSFATKMLQMGGVIPLTDIQATEFTPKDLYELNIYDTNRFPPICLK